MLQACDHAPPRTRNFDFSTGPVVVWVDTIPLCQGSYLRLDFKDLQSMPDGMGCHLPMKLREQNSELNHSGQSQFQT